MDIKSLLIGFLLGWLLAKTRQFLRHRRRLATARKYDTRDPSNQLAFLEQVELFPRNPVNKEAYTRVMTVVENTLKQRFQGFRLFAEVAMGSFIGTGFSVGTEGQRKRAYAAFGSKRVDFLIIDPFGKPVLAIEYHGTGHFRGNAAQRDAVKRAALRNAGITLIEFDHQASIDLVQAKVISALRPLRRRRC